MTVTTAPNPSKVASPPSEEARELAEAIRTHHRAVNSEKALLLEHIARFDEEDLAEHFGAVSTASWLARELNYATTTAYEYVQVGTALRRFTLIGDAFAKGELDYTTVRLLTKYLTEENQSHLLALATTLCRSELMAALAGSEKTENADPTEPYLRFRTREDGMLKGEFLLPAVAGQEFVAALKVAELAASGKSAESEAGEEEEVCPATMAAPPRPKTKMSAEDILRLPSRFGPPLKDQLYDAFITMISMVRTNPASPLRAPGAHVNIICTEDGRVWMPQNPQAPSSAIRGYVANAVARGHLLDGDGLNLYVGRQHRLATDAQVAALLAVWGHQCAMPGCTHSRFIQIHHIRDWAAGGETNVSNLIPLCSSCHSKVTHGLAHIQISSGQIEFQFIDGSRYVTQNRCLPARVPGEDGVGYDPTDLTFA